MIASSIHELSFLLTSLPPAQNVSIRNACSMIYLRVDDAPIVFTKNDIW